MEKKEKKKPLQISEVLDKYLQENYALRYVTTEQITRLLYKPSMYTTVNPRFKALKDAKYVHAFMLPTVKRFSPFIYAASAKGCRYLREQNGMDAEDYYKPSELEGIESRVHVAYPPDQ